MFCPQCGRPLPDGAKFCPGCGTALAGPAPAPARQSPPAQPRYTAPQPAPSPKKKSKAGPIIAVAAVAAALALGAFVIAPAMRGHNGSNSAPAESAQTQTIQTEPDGAAVTADGGESGGSTARPINDEYYQTLAVIGYQTPVSQVLMARDLEDPVMEFFVRDNGDGSIECYDYAADGDTLVKYNETLLLDLTVMPAEQKEQIIANLTARLPELDALDFVTAEYLERADGSFARLNVRCEGLDKQENRQTLCDMGIFSEDGTWSLPEIKEEMIALGYISLYK